MNALTAHTFGYTNIRTVVIGGDPWFVASDVCAALGIENSRDALRDHCLTHQYRCVPRSNVASGDIKFPNRGTNCVNEGGLFSLIMGSKKPQAQAFKAWVTDVVLPSIRKTGSYQLPTAKLPTGERVVIHQNLGNTKREQGERL